ncbi:unnamed protein product [Owenia fusiformis]|uniref:NOL1/NOP2/Sun domain family member 4 n=1 Tax=Owenia fusiformis TaxID=6347 RepID=A0A8J1XIU1_OWEFU|nr:unnamed protein product [Owenia fusiformis]
MFIRLLRPRSVLLIPKRGRVKTKWATHKKQKLPSLLALEHFDRFYAPMYDKLWPSIRLALLSQQKYGALINNYSNNVDSAVLDLIDTGADNFVQIAQSHKLSEASDIVDKIGLKKDVSIPEILESLQKEKEKPPLVQHDDGHHVETELDSNLYEYMPVETVYTEDELLELKETEENIFRPQDFSVDLIEDTSLSLPIQLKVHTFSRGNVTMFQPPKGDSHRLLDYYLLDAASTLPVLALGLQPRDKVLDLCAAPGGKALTILQTGLTDKLTCNDNSHSRLGRLKTVLNWYIPAADKITILKKDGTKLGHIMTEMFDKVLVDVPCLTDRHMLQTDDNNIFSSGRKRERLSLGDTQKQLLCSAILACKPGGSVVYSTCTLSPNQNDGVIQSTLEWLWENTKIDVSVCNLKPLADACSKTFRFYEHCRYGQLVIPHIRANFGPLYFAKLMRIN